MKDHFVTAIKAIISIGLMTYLLVRFLGDPVDRVVLLNTLATANYSYLFLALALFMLAVAVHGFKWYVLLKAQGIQVPLRALINYNFVGAFFNNFLPANVGGDVMRGFGLARYTERNAEAAVSVIVDRIIGLGAFMFTAVVAAWAAVWIVPAGEAQATRQNLIQVEILAIVGMGLIAGGFAVLLSGRLRRLMGKLFNLSLLKPLAPLYQRLSEAFGAYRYKYGALLWAFILGVVVVLLTGLVDVAIVAGLHGDIDPIYIFLFNPIIAILLIAPISIGGLGTGSVLYVYFYGLVGVPAALAFALSLVKQAVIYLGSLPGAVLWLRGRESGSKDKATETDSLADFPVH